MNMTVVDLRVVLRSAVDVILAGATHSGVSVVWDPAGGPCLVSGDAIRLQQVFWNVLSNAVKFTPRGGNVTVKVQSNPGAYVVVIADTGIGIDPAFLPKVFDRFQQADSS